MNEHKQRQILTHVYYTKLLAICPYFSAQLIQASSLLITFKSRRILVHQDFIYKLPSTAEEAPPSPPPMPILLSNVMQSIFYTHIKFISAVQKCVKVYQWHLSTTFYIMMEAYSGGGWLGGGGDAQVLQNTVL